MDNKINDKLTSDSIENYMELNSVEREIFDMMLPQNGVVMLQGKPGIGKTAIIRSIADKLGFQFFEFALTHIDAADLGGLPVIKERKYIVEGKEITIPQMTYAVNDWAMQANERPSILFFDEANRPADDIINALLKLFERHIGLNFKFNSNVFMIAAGNLGMEEDGTTVSALDSAMNNRIIHFPFNLTIKDWVNNFARKNVHPTIISFIEENKEHFHFMLKEQDVYASPRSWTMLSDFIVQKQRSIQQIAYLIFKYGEYYIGKHSMSQFKMYLDSLLAAEIPTMKEIMTRRPDLNKLNFSQFSYLINSFEITDVKDADKTKAVRLIDKLTDDQIATMYSRIIINVIKSSRGEMIDNSDAMEKYIQPYKSVLNVRRDISDSLINA